MVQLNIDILINYAEMLMIRCFSKILSRKLEKRIFVGFVFLLIIVTY